MTQPTPAKLCPKCFSEVREGWLVCPVCASPLRDGEAETKTIFDESSSVTSVEEGRFPAGTVLAGRYRVLGLIGQGGMGEVYRAYDLILNQAVALKFLSRANMSEAALVRFRNEVRIARQVSHPNVCRVYDIGFIEGFHFLSMEYLDGEDLASLIRRIGRLPQDKAIEFTRKICAGLSAAHDRGVLHRDLKPANIMIDGRGQVRITDFGLAALAQEIALGDIRSGTPAYMSPEQKAGKEVTTRSDLYAVGLVMYEMLVGRRHTPPDAGHGPAPLAHKDLDPAVERVILRCLEEDPKRRPSSALSIAMALPGGDPIAAALAAGETPSPEMVAASGEKQGFSPRTAAACFVGVVVTLVLSATLAGRNTVAGHAPLETPPEGLAFRAQDILKQLGYTQKPRRTAYGFTYWDLGFLRYLERRDPAQLDAVLARQQPAVIGFWYRQHQDEFWADSFLNAGGYLNDVITFDSPAHDQRGMIRMYLDPIGRLLSLDVRPSLESSATAQVKPPDWNALFVAGGLDPARFKPAAPITTPAGVYDTRMSWNGTFSGDRPEQIQVAAASFEGRPVFFRIIGDWQVREAAPAPASATTIRLFLVGLLIAILAGGILLARHNLRVGRGDRRGAGIVAAAGFLCTMSGWMFTAAHVASYWEVHLLIKALSWGGFVAALFWSLYMATEPFVRRHWPDSLISWTRLTAGRLRDPLVASHVLAGILCARGLSVWLIGLLAAAQPALGLMPNELPGLDGASSFLGFLSINAGYGLFTSLVILILLALLHPLVRRGWIADVLASILMAFGTSAGLPLFFVAGVAAAIYGALSVVRRLGLLALVASGVAYGVSITMVPSVPTWYGGRSLVILLIPAAVAAWALWVVVSAQRRPEAETAG